MSDQTSVVVLGTGSIGMRHLRILADMPGVHATAVPTRPERTSELRAKGIAALERIEQALAQRPTGVLIATDSGRHVADALQALAAGCHVLVEKPLATNGADAARITAAALGAQRRAHVASCLRFDPGLLWIRERVPQLGALRLADAECLSWLPDWRPGRDYRAGYAGRPGEGGVLLDLIHELDYTAWLLGPLELAGAVLANHGALGLPAGVEETAVLAARCGGRVPLSVRLSFARAPSSRVLRIDGERGSLRGDYVRRVATHDAPDGQSLERFEWLAPEPMYRAQLEAWVASLRGEPAEGLVSADEGARAVALCDAARALHAQGLGTR